MKQPYFEVGERVLIYSKDCPHIRGYETTIVARKYSEKGEDRFTNEILRNYWKYAVKPDPLNQLWPQQAWHESALRKKHDPGDSFDSIMQELKKPMEV